MNTQYSTQDTEQESRVHCPILHRTGKFFKSFQAIYCTATQNNQEKYIQNKPRHSCEHGVADSFFVELKLLLQG